MIKEEGLSIINAIEKSIAYLKKYNIDKPKADVEWLVAHVLNYKKLDLYLKYDEFIPKDRIFLLRKLITKRAKRIPLQYLIKEVEFAGIRLKVDNRALIPRPETELFVDLVCDKLEENFSGNIADFGTGTGAIILSICHRIKEAKGIGFEKFSDTIGLFEENISLCNLGNRIESCKFDWNKDELQENGYKLIVSNPPYLSQDEWSQAEPEVKDNEPRHALVAEKDGLSDIIKIVEIAKQSLRPKGILALEIGLGQSEQVKAIIGNSFKVSVLKDYHKINRYILAERI